MKAETMKSRHRMQNGRHCGSLSHPSLPRYSHFVATWFFFNLFLATATLQASSPQRQDSTLSRKEATDIIATSRKIVSDHGVEELFSLRINGSTQWLSVRGRDLKNPILLFLHGGPGSPTMPEAYTFQSPWEDYFTVVQWDQRGTGKTYASNDPKALAETITVEQMTNDTEEVIRQLLARYGKKKLFLLGHSWGTVLGVSVAQRHPEWIYAYVTVGQMVNARKSEAEGYQFALAQARAHNNEQAVKELEALAPYPGAQPLTLERIGAVRKWLMFYGGLTWGRQDFRYDANAWTLSPEYTDTELDLIRSGSLYSISHLLPELDALNYEHTTTFRCPVFVFVGRHDYAVSHTLSAEWFAHLHAPRKKIEWFENSAHMMMQEEPGRFLYRLITDVRPLASHDSPQ
jgi:pimeloyl-ACP methyl ester carboxylesterase